MGQDEREPEADIDLLFKGMNIPEHIKRLGIRLAGSGASSGKVPVNSDDAKSLIAALQNELVEKNEEVKRLTVTPLDCAPVLFTKEVKDAAGTAIVMYNSKMTEVILPKGMSVLPGDTVKLSRTGQIVDVLDYSPSGELAVVRTASVDANTAEVEGGGKTKIVYAGKYEGKLKAGERVILDATSSVIIGNRGKGDERFLFSEDTNVRWDDIAGVAMAKQCLIEAIEDPFRYEAIYEFYRQEPLKGVLLFGPPGCGKTMLAKAAATSNAEMHGGKGKKTALIYMRGPEAITKYLGEAEEAIRQAFATGREHKREFGYRSIFFLDEAESLLRKRGSGISSDIETTIVPMFLAEMDGLDKDGPFVILATNRADMLDDAVVRSKRVDRKVLVERPTAKEAPVYFELNLKKTPVKGKTVKEMAELAAVEMFSGKHELYEVVLGPTRDNKHLKFTLGDIASGALIAGIVQKARSIAIQRDKTQKQPEGITVDDMIQGIELALLEESSSNMDNSLGDFLKDYRPGEVRDVIKLKQVSK